MTYQPIIGLEIHAQLSTKSKAFCNEEADYGGEPNTRVSAVSFGHPGALPSVNKECIRKAVKIGLATKCSITENTHFARKNYFYPDLPKGYQISQDTTPFCTGGYLEVRLKSGEYKKIRIQRIHMEEDAGKSLHDQDLHDSLIDLNRCGVGLVEIVSMPDIRSADEAYAYITEIRKIVRYLDICDGNMEEGSLRCDANISVMPVGSTVYGTRVEVKNMNSISNVARAINYEIKRQIDTIENGGKVLGETRNWDSTTGSTHSMRMKEGAADYRYFPEPDLLPVILSQSILNEIKAELPELPEALFQKYTKQYGLPEHDATLLTEQREFVQYYEKIIAILPNYKAASNWMNGPIKTYLNETTTHILEFPIPPQSIAEIIQLIDSNQISHNAAKEQLFQLLLKAPEKTPTQLAQENNLLLSTDTTDIQQSILKILAENPDKVQTYLNGKTGLLGFLVGQIMRAVGQGKADPKLVNHLVQEALEKQRK